VGWRGRRRESNPGRAHRRASGAHRYRIQFQFDHLAQIHDKLRNLNQQWNDVIQQAVPSRLGVAQPSIYPRAPDHLARQHRIEWRERGGDIVEQGGSSTLRPQ